MKSLYDFLEDSDNFERKLFTINDKYKKEDELITILNKLDENQFMSLILLNNDDANSNNLAKWNKIKKFATLINNSLKLTEYLLNKISLDNTIKMVFNNDLFIKNKLFFNKSISVDLNVLETPVEFIVNGSPKNEKIEASNKENCLNILFEFFHEPEGVELLKRLESEKVNISLNNKKEKAYFNTVKNFMYSNSYDDQHYIDMFFAKNNWYKNLYQTRSGKDGYEDGVTLALNKINNIKNKEHSRLILKNIRDSLKNEDFKIFIQSRELNIIEQLFSINEATPKKELLKNLLKIVSYKPEEKSLTTECVLMKIFNPENLLSSFDLVVQEFGLSFIIGDKETQKKIAEEWLAKYSYILFNNTKGGSAAPLNTLCFKIYNYIKENNVDVEPHFKFVVKFMSNFSGINRNDINIKHLNIEEDYKELKNMDCTPLISSVYNLFSEPEIEDIKNMIDIKIEQDELNTTLNNNVIPNIKNNKRI